MNKFFKRLALLLAVLMFVSMMPVQLFADNSVITYVNNGTENGEDGTTTTEVASYVTVELEFGSNVSAEDIAAAKALYEGKKFDTCKAANEAYMALFGVTWKKGYLDVTDNSAPLYKYAGVSGSVAEVKYYIHGTLAGFTSLQSNGNNIDCTVGGNHQIARTSISIIGVNDENGGKAKLTDGNIQAYVAGGYISSFTASGKLTIDNIEFTSTTSTTVGASAAKDANSTQEVTSAEMEIKNCKFNGRLYVYDNFDNAGVMTYNIHDNVFDGANYNGDSNAYAIFAQCKGGNKLIIADNKISGFARGINIDHANVNATISGNTISIKDAGRSCIQLSSLTSTVISNNTLELTGGNAITLHEKLLTMTTAPAITVNGNTITGNGYLIYDDAVANNKEFTSKNLTLTIGTNTVASDVDTTQGVKGSKKSGLSETVATVVDKALTPIYVATVNGVGYATLADAIAAAKDGDTIYVSAGEYTTYDNASPKKSLIFVGAGAGNTIWTIGDLSKNVDGEGNGDYSFDGCDTITFKDMTLKVDNANYRGFIRINHTIVENCTLEGRTAYWGYETATFTGCTFNAPEGDYALWDYSTKTMTFDGCEFNISGKGVNVYVEAGNAGSEARKVEAKDCTINSTKANKAFLNIKNSTQAYEVTLSGDNKVNGLGANSTTGSNLYQVEATTITETDGKTVKVQEKASDGTLTTVYEVKAASTAVATVGGVEYATLADAIAALKSTNHTLTLIDKSAWDAATPVYWQAGTQSGYAAKLTDALTAAYKANAGDITIVCRPDADVGAMTHGHVADNLTVYGNNAYISGGECDLEVDTYMYSRETGKQVATGGVYLDKDITITAYELDNLGVWGQRHTDYTINISLNDCDGKAIEGKANVQRVYISGTTGVNNITVVGCDFLTKATALYSNADGETIIDNCSFAGSQVPVNFNHKANGTQTVTVKNSTFTNCGDNGDWKQFAAPVRFVNSGSGTLTATVDYCTFTETVGANGDILLGDGRNGKDSFNVSVTVVNTLADVQIHQPGYYGADGSTTGANCEKTTVAKSDTPTTFFTVAVAEVTFTDGTTKKYSDIAEAIAAAKNGDTVTLLADINTPEKTYEITKNLTIDLNGKTVIGSGYDGVFEVTGKNIKVVLNATNGGKVIAVENSGSAGKYAMAVWMCGAGSTLTINGGEFIQNITSTDDKQMDMIYASAGTIIINSGSFTSGTPKWTLNINDSAYKAGTANIIVNGGTFTDYDPRNAENEGKGTSLVANGVGIDKNADGTFTAKSGMAAQIVDADGNSVAAYATLADAIAAANAGDTVKLLANLTETDAANAHIVYDLTGKTLDLNGFTYSHNNFAHVFEGTGGTIKNGEMVCLNSSSYALFIGDEGETTSFTVDGVEMVGGINIYNASGVVLKNLTVNGSNYYAVWLDEHAAATIESGTYNAGSNVVFNAFKLSSLTVTGGTINTNGMGLMGTSGGTLSVSGGTFDAAVPEEYCADGFIPTQNEDGTYGVKEATKGSEKNPYTLAELGAMTRADYIEAQKALGGKMYVKIGNYSYDKDGVLGNGVRNDTPGQTPDHSKLNSYGENGYIGANNDGANGKNIIFVGGSITSGVTGYTSIDNIGTSLLLAVPAYTNVTFEGVTFENVMSFNYQLYTSPWSQLGELKFSGCTFNGLIVGAIAAQTLTFNGCEFKNYTNTTEANNSNPTWIRPAYGNWTQGDNEGQGSDFKSLTTINFTNNTVTSTRPVKFEYISQWEMDTKVTVTGNKFDIKSDGSSKNVGLYFGANAKFDLVVDNNEKTDGTAALYTAVYKAPNGTDYEGLPAGSTVKNSNGADVEVAGVIWKSTDALTLKTTTEAVELVNSKGISVKFATLEEAFAAAKNGDTITLLSDVEMTEIIRVTDSKKITLALNGFNVTITATGKFIRVCNAELTITGNSTIKEQNPYFAPIIIKGGAEGSENYSVVNIKEGVTLEGWAGVMIDQTSGTANNYGMVLNVEGATLNGVNDTDGASGSGIYVNGVVEDAKITLTNTTVTGTGAGMYLAGNADTTINGGSVKGDATGIEIRAGKLTLNNCDVTGGNGEVTATANGNGTTVTNAALAISQHTTKKPIDVTINGGTFNGTAAVYQTDVQGTGSADVKIAVKSGTFNGTISGETDGTIAISGGKFKVKVDDKYFANGHVCSGNPGADGYYTIADHPIISAGISIGEDMSFRIMVGEGYENGSLKYYYIGVNGRVEGEGTIGTDTKGNSIFRIYNINPQRADLIYVVQYYDAYGNAIGAPKEISILEYFERFYNKAAGDGEDLDARKTFIANFLEYCAASMEKSYADFPEETLDDKTWQDRADAVRAMMNRLGLVAKDYEFKGNLGRYYNDNANGVIIERGVVFGSAFKAYYKISREAIDNGYKVFRQGMDVTDKLELVDGAYIIYFELAPYEFKDNLTITVNNGTTKVCEYTSPLANTLEMLSKSTDISLAKMAKAAFNYFVALQNYNG